MSALLDCLPDDLVDRRDPFLDLLKTALPEGDHPALDRLASKLQRRSTDENQLSELFGDLHHFVETDPTLETRAVALLAALPTIGNHGPGILG